MGTLKKQKLVCKSMNIGMFKFKEFFLVRCTSVDVSSLTTFLRTNERDLARSSNGYIVYVYGSVMHSAQTTDMDVLIAYDAERVTIDRVLRMRRRLCAALTSEFGLPLDVCLLPQHELADSTFIQDEGAVQLWDCR